MPDIVLCPEAHLTLRAVCAPPPLPHVDSRAAAPSYHCCQSFSVVPSPHKRTTTKPFCFRLRKQYCHPDFAGDDPDYNGGVDICGNRDIAGLAIIGEGSSRHKEVSYGTYHSRCSCFDGLPC